MDDEVFAAAVRDVYNQYTYDDFEMGELIRALCKATSNEECQDILRGAQIGEYAPRLHR